MQKEDLKSLVTQMYEELIEKIDEQKQPNKEQILTFMQDATSTISSIDESDINSIEHAKLAFTNAYKEIAHDTINSYEQTNSTFKELSNVHKEALKECNDVHIDFSDITKKFDDIQSQMSKEVQRANEVITGLHSKIKELEHNSNFDSLTKVFNRRALTTYLNTVCSKKVLSHEMHLLILDIDDFKIINDTYGHIAGDKILIFIANMLRKTLRDGDKVFRYGGEEFIIVLNRIDSTTCLDVSNRILNLIRNNKLIYKGESLHVTMSIGATLYYKGDTPDEIITRADKALYKSKNAGKNQMNSEILHGN